MRFHSTPLGELAKTDKFFAAFEEIAQNRQGVFRCNLLELAEKLNVKPYNIPKILYGMQHSGSDNMTYDLDRECFILEFLRIPSQADIYELSQDMLAETRKIENNLVSKLNSIYFAARKVSLPNVGFMLKKETELEEKTEGSSKEMYLDFSYKLNVLINQYFSAKKGDDIELKIAGSQEERSLMMPLLYIDDEEIKKQISRDMEEVLRTFVTGNPGGARMKPLDVIKVLMGIRSERDCVKQFLNDGKFFARYHEYDYEQLVKLADSVVKKWTIDNIHLLEGNLTNTKRKKTN